MNPCIEAAVYQKETRMTNSDPTKKVAPILNEASDIEIKELHLPERLQEKLLAAMSDNYADTPAGAYVGHVDKTDHTDAPAPHVDISD